MKCLVLAGGFGTRLYPLTITRAKALLEHNDKPLATHIIEKVPQNMDILVSVNRKFEHDFRQWQCGINRDIEICVENVSTVKQKKGAVSALLYWINEKNITEDLFVIAGDNYFELSLQQFIAAYDEVHTLVAIHDVLDTVSARHFGVVSVDGDRIVSFAEKPANPTSSLIATAIYILPPRVFHLLRRYCSEGLKDSLGSFVSYLVETDEVRTFIFKDQWLDIGNVNNPA